jgi:hypothetical protein
MKLNWSKIIPSANVSSPWMKLLKRYVTKEIDAEEFDREIAYGAMESIEALVYRDVPAMPEALQKAVDKRKYSKSPKEKEKLTAVINKHAKFFDDTSSIEASNNSHFGWLKNYLSWLPEEDQVNRSRIIKVIKTHDPNFRPPDKRADNQRTTRNLPAVPGSHDRDTPSDTKHKDKPQAVS